MKEWKKMLDFLHKNGKKKTSEIANHFGKSLPNVYSNLDIIKRMDLIKREVIKVPGSAGTKKVVRKIAFWYVNPKYSSEKLEKIINSEKGTSNSQAQSEEINK